MNAYVVYSDQGVHLAAVNDEQSTAVNGEHLGQVYTSERVRGCTPNSGVHLAAVNGEHLASVHPRSEQSTVANGEHLTAVHQ